MPRRTVARRTAEIEATTAREIAGVRNAGARAAHRISTQADREVAAITAISSVCSATEALPDDFPDMPRRMAHRIAVGSSRFIGRLL